MNITRRAVLGGGAGALIAPAANALQLKHRPQKRRKGRKVNIVLISIDDLNDYIAPLGGYPGVRTPNMSRLADMGACFTSAMTHVPVCNPSRASVLTGGAAHKTGIYYNSQDWRDSLLPGKGRSIPGQLRAKGWSSIGAGKIFHGFEKFLRRRDWDDYFVPENYGKSQNDRGAKRSIWARNHEDDVYDFGPGRRGSKLDIEVADWAHDKIKSGYLDGSNAFLGIGLYRPHVPTVVSKKWFDYYEGDLPAPPGFWPGATDYSGNATDLADLPPRAAKLGNEFLGPRLDEFNEHQAFLRSYLAAVTFTDHQLGRILKALDKADAMSNTYIVLWSDHGWHLGEKMRFSKQTLWERALRVPFMIAGPGIEPQTIAEPVSLLDIYPTIMSLAGLPIPKWCDGRDLSKTLLKGKPIADPAAVSVWSRADEADTESPEIYTSVRTPDYRLISYGEGQYELYDHRVDPWEFDNLADTADPGLIAALEAYLPDHFEPPR